MISTYESYNKTNGVNRKHYKTPTKYYKQNNKNKTVRVNT